MHRLDLHPAPGMARRRCRPGNVRVAARGRSARGRAPADQVRPPATSAGVGVPEEGQRDLELLAEDGQRPLDARPARRRRAPRRSAGRRARPRAPSARAIAMSSPRRIAAVDPDLGAAADGRRRPPRGRRPCAGTRSSWRAPWLLTTMRVDAVLDGEPGVLGGQDALERRAAGRPGPDRREIGPDERRLQLVVEPREPPRRWRAAVGRPRYSAKLPSGRRARTRSADRGRGSRAREGRRSGRSRRSRPPRRVRPAARPARIRLDVELEPAHAVRARPPRPPRSSGTRSWRGCTGPRPPPPRGRGELAVGMGERLDRHRGDRDGQRHRRRRAWSWRVDADDVDEDPRPEPAAPPRGLVLGQGRSSSHDPPAT